MPGAFIIKVILCLEIVFMTVVGWGQSINYKMNYYSIKDGLPNREVYDAIQDAQGFIWILTYKHLSRFDGYTFSDITKLVNQGFNKRKTELTNGEDAKFERLSKDLILIKYAKENSRFDLLNTSEIEVKNYNLSNLFSTKRVIGFVARATQQTVEVFCLEKNEIVLYSFNPLDHKIERLINFPLPDNFQDSLKNVQIEQDKLSGNIYFTAASLPVILFNTQRTTTSLSIPSVPHGKIYALVNSKLAVVDTSQNRILIYSTEDQSVCIIGKPLQSNNISQMWSDLDGNLLVASINNLVYKKLALINHINNKVIPLDHILETEKLISHFGGDHFLEQILLSTYSGFYTLSNEKKIFKSLLTTKLKNGNWGHIIRSMAEDGRGNLFVNTEKNEIFKMDMQKDSIIRTYKNSPYDEVSIDGSMKMIGENLWGVCAKTPDYDQLYSFNTVTEKFKYWPMPFKAYVIKAMMVVDSNQLVCFGRDFKLDTTAVYRFNLKTGKFENLSLSPKLPKLRYQYVFKDKNQVSWIGSSKGLYRFSLEDKKLEKIDFGPPENPQLDISVQTIATQPLTNHLILGTEYGVFIFDQVNRKFIDHFTRESIGLCNDNIEGLIPKNEYEIFVSTDNGLTLANTKTRQARNYYENDGLAHNEFNVLANHKGSNGHYYFGGTNGITIVTDSSLNKYNSKKVAISRFYTYNSKTGNEVSIAGNMENVKTLTIEPEEQYFGFDLMYPDYTEPRLNQYQSWLEEYEKDWQSPSTNSKLRYGRLPKGNYTLHLRAFPNVSNEQKIGVQVKEHFYRSPWFGAGISVLLLSSGLGLYYRAQNKKRTKELEKQKTAQKFKDLEAAALRAQMNPHFIFNCLGSIQQFVTSHDTESASKYLGNFSRLIRLALHSSVDGRHSLQDEIEMLDNYLGLERLRFGDKFTYEIQVDPKLDKEDIFFPPLLIQPFVENALVHGMKNKTEGGKIMISFKEENDQILASVTDNGPGVSTEKRSMDSSGHRSVGMTLTKKRLEILSGKDTFTMKHVIGPDGVPAGTQINILIPMS